jgi:hypothetical protein
VLYKQQVMNFLLTCKYKISFSRISSPGRNNIVLLTSSVAQDAFYTMAEVSFSAEGKAAGT